MGRLHSSPVVNRAPCSRGGLPSPSFLLFDVPPRGGVSANFLPSPSVRSDFIPPSLQSPDLTPRSSPRARWTVTMWPCRNTADTALLSAAELAWAHESWNVRERAPLWRVLKCRKRSGEQLDRAAVARHGAGNWTGRHKDGTAPSAASQRPRDRCCSLLLKLLPRRDGCGG